METYIPKSSIRPIQRNLINTVRQNKQQLSFTDNRPVAVSQRKTLQNMGQQKPMQMKRVVDDMVSNDLRCELRNRFFTSDTIKAYWTAKKSGKRTAEFVAENRANIEYAYLGGQVINNTNLNNWLTGKGEKIYLYQEGQLIGGNNLEGTNKICHPNLIGGDPDVDYAGTIEYGITHWHVTRNSGHFQPGPDDATRQQIADHMNFLYGRQGNPLFLPH